MSLYAVELFKSMRQLHKPKNDDQVVFRQLTTASDLILFSIAILLIIPTFTISLLL